MVLQQQTDAPIWGKATGKSVKLTTSWDKQTYTAQPDAGGKWSIRVKTPTAGGPYSISISDGKELTLKNILIGEVWICSGQSNMEMPLAGWGKILNYESEIASADYPKIRLLHIKKTTSPQLRNNIETENNGWQVCSPSTIAEFSSVAYFFGRDLNQKLNVPVGLINTSWGGTIAEAWTSGESLEYMPYFEQALLTVRQQQPREETQDAYNKKLKDWSTRVLAADKGLVKNTPVWANAQLDETGWDNMLLPCLWEKSKLGDCDGIIWFRKTIDIPAAWEGKDLKLHLDVIDDSDITYYNGTPVGSTDGYETERVYVVPGKTVKKGKAVITVRVTDTGGGGGIYGDATKLFVELDKTEKIALSGDWKYKQAVDFKEFPSPQSSLNPNQPTVLYNAMIHPLVPYAIQGAIWYQGESNADRAYQYRELFPLMIRDWRKAWNKDFPFYFVQLANFMERKAEPQESDWAKLREAQLQTLNLDNTGMAVTIDIGDAKDIHPKNKQEVGRRLALAAEANTYKQKNDFSGPVYKSYKIEGDKIRILFHYAGGLKSGDGKALTGFAIAGPDHTFHWANAVIEGDEVIVRSPDVKFPVAVRYAWADNPECNLYNSANLPASPFRTDDWR
ncbi:MAG: sialate O-acetylesterase [Dysgonamonadaceae bacterium]|nr:sialate O-acetylesterase [Dysgonamonadaceae bacterium]